MATTTMEIVLNWWVDSGWDLARGESYRTFWNLMTGEHLA